MGGGSNNFFAKVAGYDPIAQALHLPGSGAAAKGRLDKANGQLDNGPYAGVAPTMASAAAGYQPGGVGSNPDYKPFQLGNVGGNFFQKAAGMSGTVTPAINPTKFAGPTYGSTAPTQGPNSIGGQAAAVNPYVAASQQSLKNPQAQTPSPWSTAGQGKIGGVSGV